MSLPKLTNHQSSEKNQILRRNSPGRWLEPGEFSVHFQFPLLYQQEIDLLGSATVSNLLLMVFVSIAELVQGGHDRFERVGLW